MPNCRSPAAEKMRRYRERVRAGIACVPVPVTRMIIDYLDRERLLPQGREAVDRSESAPRSPQPSIRGGELPRLDRRN